MQTIKTPGGETLVILSLAEYEALEDARDAATADRIKADIAAGRSEMVPAEIANRLLLGAENPVRVWREHRGLSGRALAEAVGISAGFLSEIEQGKKECSVSVLKRLAAALCVDMDDLVPVEQE